MTVERRVLYSLSFVASLSRSDESVMRLSTFDGELS